ncbi:MAG: substrate-binding domain-containing protein [Bryobacteraceae bacterium]
MRPRLAVAISIAILAGGLSGCQRDSRRTIAVIPKATSHLFWQSVQAGAIAAGREFDAEILWNGPPLETEYSRQIQIVDSMIARRVDGIAVAATERKALVQPIERAAAAGIPVTVFDSGVETTNYLTFVATNNYEGGKLAARSLAGMLNGRGKVVMVMNAPGSASTMDRERGFEEAIAEEFPQIQVVGRQFGLSDRAKAMAAAENLLTAHPGLDGIFASSEPSSVGTAKALKARGLSGKISLVAFDSSEGLVEDLKGGTIHALVVQDPFRMGYEAVRTIVDKLDGKEPPKRLDLEARVVRGADLTQPEIRQLLFPDLAKYLKQ